VTSEHDEAADTAPPPVERRGGMHSLAREVVIVVGTALVLSLLIKTFLAQAFYIPSESMEDTLLTGDRVLVNLLQPGPFDIERGDVVVFKDPGGWLTGVATPSRGPVAQGAVEVLTFIGVLPQDAGEHLIKRVVGLPGDRVACCDDEDRLTVNGAAVEETYLADGAEPSELTFDVEVPPGRLWVMGDNRQFSRDSRWHQELPGEGTISEESLVGRAVVVFWPWSRRATLPSHSEVYAAVPASADPGSAGSVGSVGSAGAAGAAGAARAGSADPAGSP